MENICTSIKTIRRSDKCNANHVDRSLEDIEEEIDQYQDDIERNFLKIGRSLLEAKKLVGKHGEWLDWLKGHVDMSITKAQRLMRVAEKFNENEALALHMGFTNAYLLTLLPEQYFEEIAAQEFLAEDGTVKKYKDLRKRDAERVVRKYKNDLKTKSKNVKAAFPAVDEDGVAPSDISLLGEFNTLKERMTSFTQNIIIQKESCGDLLSSFLELCTQIVSSLSCEEMK